MVGVSTLPGDLTIWTGMSPSFACPERCMGIALPAARACVVIATTLPVPLSDWSP